MTERTESELLFEELCSTLGLPCNAVAVGRRRTPDYEVTLQTGRLVVEVKQLDPTEADRQRERDLLAGKASSYHFEPGKRIRQLITRAKGQIKRLAKGKYPGVLALYNNIPFGEAFTDPMCILVAMFGHITVPVSVPIDPSQSPRFLGPRFGPKRSLTTAHNTSISTVAVIYREPAGYPGITFYHNPFAAIPFDPTWLRGEQVKHYRAPTAPSGRFEFWAPA